MNSMLCCLLCSDSTSAAVSCEASDEAHSGLGLSGLTAAQCSTATKKQQKNPGWFEMINFNSRENSPYRAEMRLRDH